MPACRMLIKARTIQKGWPINPRTRHAPHSPHRMSRRLSALGGIDPLAHAIH